jgi:hypothetical protein
MGLFSKRKFKIGRSDINALLALERSEDVRKRRAKALGEIMHTVNLVQYTCVVTTPEGIALDVNQVIPAVDTMPYIDQCMAHCIHFFGRDISDMQVYASK